MWLVEADKALFAYLTLYCNPPWLSRLSEEIGNLSNYAIPALVFCLLYYWLNSPRFLRFVIAVVILLVFSEGICSIVKYWVARPRPAVEWLIYVDPKALGFPSAHAVNSMALAYFFSRWFGISIAWYLPLPLVMGASRVLANYHYPLDVVFGWLLGFSIAMLHWRFFAQKQSLR